MRSSVLHTVDVNVNSGGSGSRGGDVVAEGGDGGDVPVLETYASQSLSDEQLMFNITLSRSEREMYGGWCYVFCF